MNVWKERNDQLAMTLRSGLAVKWIRRDGFANIIHPEHNDSDLVGSRHSHHGFRP
jgi:hypothetical protein